MFHAVVTNHPNSSPAKLLHQTAHCFTIYCRRWNDGKTSVGTAPCHAGLLMAIPESAGGLSHFLQQSVPTAFASVVQKPPTTPTSCCSS